jgi:serine/threonine protein kinase
MPAVCPKCTHAIALGDRGIAQLPELCPRCLSPLDDLRRPAGGRADFDDDSRYNGRRLEPYRSPEPRRISGPEDFPSCLGMRPVEESAVGGLGEFGHYQILGFLARGGMGAVFKARCMRSDRVVALKVPSSRCMSDPDEHRRFVLESELAQNLRHPNICSVIEVGMTGGRPFLAMEFIDGMHLRKWVAKTRPSLNDVALIVAKLARALHYAHGCGVVHRDIKPENIMVRAADKEPILLDFGLAHAEHSDSVTTMSGLVAGTPSYMAPEYAFGAKAGPSTDVYALGAVFYELITGRPPYVGAPGDVLMALRDGPPPAPRQVNFEIPAALDKVCRTAIARAAENRFADADVFSHSIEDAVYGRLLDTARLKAVPAPVRPEFLSGPRPPLAEPAGKSRRWVALVGFVAGLAAAAAAWLLLGPF